MIDNKSVRGVVVAEVLDIASRLPAMAAKPDVMRPALRRHVGAWLSMNSAVAIPHAARRCCDYMRAGWQVAEARDQALIDWEATRIASGDRAKLFALIERNAGAMAEGDKAEATFEAYWANRRGDNK